MVALFFSHSGASSSSRSLSYLDDRPTGTFKEPMHR